MMWLHTHTHTHRDTYTQVIMQSHWGKRKIWSGDETSCGGERKKSRQWVCYKATLLSLGADVNLHYQGVFSCVSPVPAFATRIKMKWSNQSSALFTDHKIDPSCQCFKRWHKSDNPLTIQRWNMFYGDLISCVFYSLTYMSSHWPDFSMTVWPISLYSYIHLKLLVWMARFGI